MVITCVGHDSGGSLFFTLTCLLYAPLPPDSCLSLYCYDSPGTFSRLRTAFLTCSDLYETGLTVYKDTQLGDLLPKLLLKHCILNLTRLVILICLFLFIFFKIDTSDL